MSYISFYKLLTGQAWTIYNFLKVQLFNTWKKSRTWRHLVWSSSRSKVCSGRPPRKWNLTDRWAGRRACGWKCWLACQHPKFCFQIYYIHCWFFIKWFNDFYQPHCRLFQSIFAQLITIMFVNQNLSIIATSDYFFFFKSIDFCIQSKWSILFLLNKTSHMDTKNTTIWIKYF